MAIFLTVYPRDFATGDPITVKATSSGDPIHVNRAGGPWLPALTEQTTLKRDFFDGDFSRSLAPPSASLKLSATVLAISHPEIARARWAGAKAVIEFCKKNSAARAAKRAAKIAKDLAKLNVLTVESSEVVRENGGFDGVYRVTTDKGDKMVRINTIYAGGYNIQCLHTRVLVSVK
jgi:hypothetical protein